MTILLFHCLLCITILRRRIRHRTRVSKRWTRYWFSYLYHNILLILYSILLTWPQPFQSFLFYHVICPHFFSFGSHPANSAFPTIFTMCFLFGKQNCIIPKLNSDWLIPIKVHPSFKKKQDEILFHQSPSKFLIKVFFDRCHYQKSFKNFTKKTWSKKTWSKSCVVLHYQCFSDDWSKKRQEFNVYKE